MGTTAKCLPISSGRSRERCRKYLPMEPRTPKAAPQRLPSGVPKPLPAQRRGRSLGKRSPSGQHPQRNRRQGTGRLERGQRHSSAQPVQKYGNPVQATRRQTTLPAFRVPHRRSPHSGGRDQRFRLLGHAPICPGGADCVCCMKGEGNGVIDAQFC
jgi:hypothetical protein